LSCADAISVTYLPSSLRSSTFDPQRRLVRSRCRVRR